MLHSRSPKLPPRPPLGPRQAEEMRTRIELEKALTSAQKVEELLPMELWSDDRVIEAFWDAGIFLDYEADEVVVEKEDLPVDFVNEVPPLIKAGMEIAQLREQLAEERARRELLMSHVINQQMVVAVPSKMLVSTEFIQDYDDVHRHIL